MSQQTTNFLNAIDPYCKKYYNLRNAQIEHVWPAFYKQEDVDSLIFSASGERGFSRFQQISEGTDFPELEQYDIPTTEVTIVKYAGEFQITEELRLSYEKLRKMDKVREKIEMLADSLNDTLDYLAFAMLNNGFTATIGDGQPLFSDSHPIRSGGTRDNKAAADLSQAALAAAIAAMGTYPDDHGDFRTWRPAYLIVPESLRVTALQIVQSEYTADNLSQPNVDKYVKGLQVISSSWIDMVDTDSWFLVCDAEKTPLIWYWFERSDIYSEVLRNRDIVYNDRFYAAQVAIDDCGIYGSTGT